MAKANAQSGRALDKLMAENILDHTVFHDTHGSVREKLPNGQSRPLRPYSLDISAAWEVAAKVGVSLLPTTEGWFALIGDTPHWSHPREFVDYLAKADFVNAGAGLSESPAMAICLAALRWLENKEARVSQTSDSQVALDPSSVAESPLTH